MQIPSKFCHRHLQTIPIVLDRRSLNNLPTSARSTESDDYRNIPTGKTIRNVGNSVFCLLNARSVINKTMTIKYFIVDNNIDIMSLTETWLKSGDTDDLTIRDLCPTGFSMLNVPRGSRGGGVVLLYRKSFVMKNQTHNISYKSFEVCDTIIHHLGSSLRLVTFYHPPPSSSNGSTLELFF